MRYLMTSNLNPVCETFECFEDALDSAATDDGVYYILIIGQDGEPCGKFMATSVDGACLVNRLN